MKRIVITVPDAVQRRTDFIKDYPYKLGSFDFYFGKGKNEVIPPNWWLSKPSHWALVENYINIFERYAGEDLLIFEDDCSFCTNFLYKYKTYLKSVPKNADLIYLGVIHRSEPVSINEKVVKVVSGVSSHAIIYKKKSIPTLLKYLKSSDWVGYHGYDERLAFLQKNQLITAYAPVEPLCGQKAGYSYIMETNRESFLL